MAATVSRLDRPRPPPHRFCACGRQRRDTNARMGIVTRTAEYVNTLAASLTGRDELTRRRCGFLHTPVLDTSSTQRRRRCSDRSRNPDTGRAVRHRSDKWHAHGRIAKRQIRRSAAAQRRTQPSPSLPGRWPSGEVHRRGAARQVSSDTSLEVRCLSAEAATVIVTCRIASPTPSALRVSHSLSGFIPPTPRGSISRHIHP